MPTCFGELRGGTSASAFAAGRFVALLYLRTAVGLVGGWVAWLVGVACGTWVSIFVPVPRSVLAYFGSTIISDV